MYHKVHGNEEVLCWAALACLLGVPGDIGCTIGVGLASLHVGAAFSGVTVVETPLPRGGLIPLSVSNKR